MTLLFCSRFDTKPEGHGGQRRATQLWEILCDAGLEPVVYKMSAVQGSGVKARIIRYKTGLVRSTYFGKWPRFGRSNFRYGSAYLPEIDACLRRAVSPILILEDTVSFHVIPEARRRGWRVIALPQNIESLYAARESGKQISLACSDLSDELTALAMADVVYCISREEQWLLRGFGINAGFLPYFPPKQVVSQMEKVRELRRGASKQHVLVLGNAHNGPNLAGMVDLLDRIAGFGSDALPPIIVAGFGTESLRTSCLPSTVRVAGTVSESELMQLLVESRALLVNQQFGFGSLTKLAEALVAGVPVIASTIAARSHIEFDGVYTFGSDTELYSLLRNRQEQPTAPGPPIAQQMEFLASVGGMMKAGSR